MIDEQIEKIILNSCLLRVCIAQTRDKYSSTTLPYINLLVDIFRGEYWYTLLYVCGAGASLPNNEVL